MTGWRRQPTIRQSDENIGAIGNGEPQYRATDLGRPTPRRSVIVALLQALLASVSPIVCAVAGIRPGLKTSTDKLLRFAGSTECGHKSAMLKHPGWDGFDDGFLLFAVDQPPQ